MGTAQKPSNPPPANPGRGGTGPSEREGRRLGPLRRVFAVLTPRLLPAAPSPLGGQGQHARLGGAGVPQARGEEKGQSVVPTSSRPAPGLAPLLTTSARGRERPSPAAPACPSPSAARGHWPPRPPPRGRKAGASLAPARKAGLERVGAPAVFSSSGNLWELRQVRGRRRWCRLCVTWALPADGPAGVSPGTSPRHAAPPWGGPGRCARVSAELALGE